MNNCLHISIEEEKIYKLLFSREQFSVLLFLRDVFLYFFYTNKPENNSCFRIEAIYSYQRPLSLRRFCKYNIKRRHKH